MRDLLAIAKARGLTVHATHMPPGWLGSYNHETRRIFFDLGLTPAERRVTIAHELGHEFYGDRCSSPEAEDKADAYAASLLIDPEEYCELERIDPDVESLADAFVVTVECIRNFQRFCLKPIGGSVYVKQTNQRERRIA